MKKSILLVSFAGLLCGTPAFAQTNQADYTVSASTAYPDLIGDYEFSGLQNAAPYFHKIGEEDLILIHHSFSWRFGRLVQTNAIPRSENISTWLSSAYSTFPVSPSNLIFSGGTVVVDNQLNRTLTEFGVYTNNPAYFVEQVTGGGTNGPGAYKPVGFHNTGSLYYQHAANPSQYIWLDETTENWILGSTTSSPPASTASDFSQIDYIFYYDFDAFTPAGFYHGDSLVVPADIVTNTSIGFGIRSDTHYHTDGRFQYTGLDENVSPYFTHTEDPTILLARDPDTGNWMTFQVIDTNILHLGIIQSNNMTSIFETITQLYPYNPLNYTSTSHLVMQGGFQGDASALGFNPYVPMYTVTSSVDTNANGHYVPAGLDLYGNLYFRKYLEPSYIIMRRLTNHYVKTDVMDHWTLGQTTDEIPWYTSTNYTEIDFRVTGELLNPTGTMASATTIDVFSGTVSWPTHPSHPDWWFTHGLESPVQFPNHHAAANLGQLANFAYAAHLEMESNWSHLGGSGPGISNLVADLLNPNTPPTNFYAAANVGQIKAVTSLFYDRRAEVGLDGAYPWTTTSNDNHHATANVGQLKHVFSFAIPDYSTNGDADGDGLSDAWEFAHGLNWNSSLGDDGASGDPDADGLSNLEEVQLGTDPNRPDNPAVRFLVFTPGYPE